MSRRHFMIGFITLAFAALTSAPIPVLAADGDLDPTFGIGGRARYEDSSGWLSGSASAIQSDGKIIVAGSIGDLSSAAFVLARFNADGSLDTTFGVGGRVTTDFGNLGPTGVNAIAIQPDGKILAAGEAGTNSNPDFALARYNPDGSLDDIFGIGGKVTTDFFGLYESAAALAIQSDGKIVAGGLVYSGRVPMSDFGLVRFDPDGSLDTSFGIAGKVTTDFLGREDWARAVAIQSDGKIIAAGSMAIPPDGTPYSEFLWRGALVRYNKDGSLDSTFGTGGKVITEILGPSALNALSIQSDGKIIAAGHSGVLHGTISAGRWFELFRSGPTGMDFGLVRYNEDGSLDTTFGAQGKVVTDLNTPSDVIYAVSLQPDGKIIAASGNAGLCFKCTNASDWGPLARYNRDGSLDTTFGIGGKVRMDLPAGHAVYAHFAGIQPDGKIVVTGLGVTYNEDRLVRDTFFELARYDNKGLQIVSAIDLAASSIRIGGSMSVRLSGSNLTDRTWFDVRFRAPGSTTDQVGLNWQQGTSARHTVATGTEAGTWIVTGIRAHENLDDHGDEFVPISATLTVTGGGF